MESDMDTTDDTDELFGVTLRESDPIVNGKRVWAPGWLYYCAHGCGDVQNIRNTVDPSDTRGPLPLLLLPFDAGVRGHVVSISPYQTFWISTVERMSCDLQALLRELLEKDDNLKAVESFQWIIHTGIMFLLRNNPHQAETILSTILNRYDAFLYGDEFTKYRAGVTIAVVAWLHTLHCHVGKSMFFNCSSIPFAPLQAPEITTRSETWEYAIEYGMRIPVVIMFQNHDL